MAINDPVKYGTKKVAYRSHLPPPFYGAKDELHRVGYPSEARLQRGVGEDIGNYGTGGYYGNTYLQETYNQERSRTGESASGHADTYRDLGDRRWSRDRRRAWESESFSRHGYSSLDERMRMSQSHRGKGPRSYQRSDMRILEDLNDRLYDDPFLNAADIETVVENGEVILSGTVEDKQSKRRAEDIAEDVSGVHNVLNRLKILQ